MTQKKNVRIANLSHIRDPINGSTYKTIYIYNINCKKKYTKRTKSNIYYNFSNCTNAVLTKLFHQHSVYMFRSVLHHIWEVCLVEMTTTRNGKAHCRVNAAFVGHVESVYLIEYARMSRWEWITWWCDKGTSNKWFIKENRTVWEVGRDPGWPSKTDYRWYRTEDPGWHVWKGW